MSGQPYRYVKDIENFRNEYMDALNLRANIDDMNFQANKIYKETGALPPKSTIRSNPSLRKFKIRGNWLIIFNCPLTLFTPQSLSIKLTYFNIGSISFATKTCNSAFG